jgi:hypothetical protein
MTKSNNWNHPPAAVSESYSSTAMAGSLVSLLFSKMILLQSDSGDTAHRSTRGGEPMALFCGGR